MLSAFSAARQRRNQSKRSIGREFGPPPAQFATQGRSMFRAHECAAACYLWQARCCASPCLEAHLVHELGVLDSEQQSDSTRLHSLHIIGVPKQFWH